MVLVAARIAGEFTERRFAAGEALHREGEPHQGLAIITEGMAGAFTLRWASVHRPVPGRELQAHALDVEGSWRLP